MKEVVIRPGYFNQDGKSLKTAVDVLNASCICGIDCCNGIVKTKNYNPISGDFTIGAFILLDGVVQHRDSYEDAYNEVQALKAIVPPTLPTTPITNGSLRFNVGNTDDNIPYLSGNIYQLNTTSALVGREINLSILGTAVQVILTSVTPGFVLTKNNLDPVTLPYTVAQSGGADDYTFALLSGTDIAPVTVNIGFTYLGQPYVIRLNRTV